MSWRGCCRDFWGEGDRAGDALDAAVVPSLPGERGALAVKRAGLQPGQSLAAARAAAANQELVADELAAPADEDGRTIGQACWLLLAPAGRGSSQPEAVWRDAAADLGAACAGRVTPTARTAGLAGCRGVGAGELLPKSPLRSPERYDRADSKVGAAAKGVPNVAVVRKPLHRGRGSATLLFPGQPKRKSWSTAQRHRRLTAHGLTAHSHASDHQPPIPPRPAFVERPHPVTSRRVFRSPPPPAFMRQ